MALRSALPVLPVLAALAVGSAPRPAAAQPALALFSQGRALVEKGDYAAACPLFAEAHRLQPTAIGIVINLGDCYNNTGKTASAWSAYREGEFLAKKSGENERATYAHDHAAALEPRLSHLKIVAEATPGLIVHRDDQEVGKGILGTSFPVDPGPHKIEATAPGYLVWSTSLTVGAEHDEQVVTIPALGKAAGGTDGGGSGGPFVWTGQRIAGLGVTLAGVAGLAVGGVLGGLAISKNNASKADCAPGQPNLCLASDVSARQSAGTLADASTGVLIGGGVAAVAGVIVLLTGAPKGGPAKTGRIEVTPVLGSKTAGLGLRGAW